jgi:hypothetical protein
MMEAASISETSVNFNKTARRNNLEDSHLQIRKSKKYSEQAVLPYGKESEETDIGSTLSHLGLQRYFS